ncbi:MAG TPA: DUF4405 domain-containing protein [Coriobacteriia bacterium]|nr:DUF4405 domain-containing protein [Coriobacteriia bacterium]
MDNKKRLLLDIAMFAAIVVLMNPILTGINAHIWIGLALFVPALLHVALNWDWAMRTVDRLFEAIRGASRAKLALGFALFVSFVTVMLSGVMVVPAVANSFIAAYAAWHALHSLSAWAFTGLALTHLVIHARWIAGVLQRGYTTTVRPSEGALR